MFSYSEYQNIFVAIGKEPVTVEEQPEEENDEEDEVIDAVSVVLFCTQFCFKIRSCFL